MRESLPGLSVWILLLAGSGLLAADGAISVAEDAAGAVPSIFQNEVDKTSYAIGMSIGRTLRDKKVEVNTEVLFQGIKDIIENKECLLSNEDFMKTMRLFTVAQQKQQALAKQALSKENLQAAQAFLAENKAKEGVHVTESGLQYQVLTPGTGAKPTRTDKVRVHYHGTLIDGKVFDSSVQKGKPAEFMVTQVIPGWVEALQMMEVGAKWKLFIPPELAYGEQGRPTIPPNSVLIFEVELLDILTPPPAGDAQEK